jgi:hypothetical protein
MSHSQNPRQIVLAVIITALVILGAITPLFAGTDIDVIYISRTPRYDRYNVTYTDGIDPVDLGKARPSLSPEEQSKKRWPSKGEEVTFTAVIKNPGDTKTGEFSYKWYFDGKEVGSGTLPSITPGVRTSTSYKWKWDSEWNNHYIKFVADPSNKVKEEIEVNNVVEDRTNALCYRFHCYQKLYDWFLIEARKLNPDIATYEDWAQNQMRLMNKVFTEAVYPTSPKGILERVRLDEVVVEPDDAPNQDPTATHAPEDWGWDGKWGFDGNYIEIFINNPDFIKGIYTWGLHEHSHQLGMIDLYQMNIELDGANGIKPQIGHFNSFTGCVMSTSGSTHYSAHTAYAMNSNLHERRGYFGEYLYDVPKICKLKLFDAYHRPLANQKITFYQDEGRQFNQSAIFTGTTDENGKFTLPNRTCLGEITTATGHSLRDNPWGMINVVGMNGLFFCDITRGDQTDYQYIEILPFNMAYAKGQKNEWTYEMQTSIVPNGRVTGDNLYAVKMVSSKLGYAVGDSGTILKWDGNAWTVSDSNTYQTLNAIDASPDGKIALAVGNDGAIVVSDSAPWKKSPTPTDKNLRACAFPMNEKCFIGGDSGALYIARLNEDEWTKLDVTDSTIRALKFTGNKGIMVCDHGKTYYTTDMGETWTEGGQAGGTPLTAVAISSETEAYTCNDNGDVFKSTDFGKNWTRIAEFGRQPMYGLDVKNGKGWVSGRYHQFYNVAIPERIKDGAFSQQPINTYEDSDMIFGISCVSENDAWAVGKSGLILHFVDSGE